MTPEALDLTRRIAAAEAALEAEQDAWDEQAEPLEMNLAKELEWAQMSGEWKRVRIARLELRQIGPRPVEGYGLMMLKGRLERLVAA